MRNRVQTAAAITLLIAAAAFATATVRFGTATSTVSIKGTSTLHEWEMKGSTIRGSIDLSPELVAATTPEAWTDTASRPVTVNVTIPVTSLRSQHGKMDTLMQEALKTKANPEIRYQLTSAGILRGGTDTFVVRTRGKLTIAGVTRDVAMDVAAARQGDKSYVLTGETPIKMTEFGIKPPTAMLGTIRTGDQVKVAFRWTVDRAQ
ncbi:MAG TPA: YceI family protein [Thermoanaerobaculia bacterium]|nr:YceI family protein [Thermoanaerobaculia bacterium]